MTHTALTWEECSTGGGCMALATSDGRYLITDSAEEYTLPKAGQPADIGFYDETGCQIGWLHCQTLEAAMLVAEMVAERWES